MFSKLNLNQIKRYSLFLGGIFFTFFIAMLGYLLVKLPGFSQIERWHAPLSLLLFIVNYLVILKSFVLVFRFLPNGYCAPRLFYMV